MAATSFDPPVVTDAEAEEARLDARAIADAEAGRVVPHEDVVAWLRSWGTPEELPRPRPKVR